MPRGVGGDLRSGFYDVDELLTPDLEGGGGGGGTCEKGPVLWFLISI
jgi:hypothetical protein